MKKILIFINDLNGISLLHVKQIKKIFLNNILGYYPSFIKIVLKYI